MDYILIALATFFNLFIIKWKIEHKRYEDAILDACILFGLSSVFSGSYGGLVVATITSAMISLYFMISPPSFTKGFFSELKKRTKRHTDV